MGVWQWLQTIFSEGGDRLTDKQLTRLENFAQAVKTATARQVIHIQALPSANLSITDSKFGGYPYVPKNGHIPRDSEGNPFFMVAQINCEQLPENNIYPKKGLLQFWIIDGDDLFGMDLENPCSNAGKRILYFPELTESLSLDEVKLQYVLTEEYTPITPYKEIALSFTRREEGITLSDINFDRLFTNLWNETFSDDIKEIWNLPRETCQIIDKLLLKDPTGHKIGGYPYFTQVDPREENDPHTFLLLQIDTDEVDNKEILWGDCGVANFFISPEDLAACQFGNVLYNWDCS